MFVHNRPVRCNTILLRYNKISPFLVDRQCGITCDDNAIGVEGVFLLNINGVYGEGKSKDPIGEAKCIIGKLKWFFQVLILYAICIDESVTMDCVYHITGHLLL